MRALCLLSLCAIALAAKPRAYGMIDEADFGPASAFRVTTRQHNPSKYGITTWNTVEQEHELNVKDTVVVVVDMWDKHWCSTATQRVGQLAEWMNETLVGVRAAGIKIIHAPSECQDFYEGHPARLRVQALPNVPMPEDRNHTNPAQPIDDSDGGCDWPEDKEHPVWTRQNPLIHIDEDHDYILSDNKTEAYNLYSHLGAKNIVYMGVHLNMCILYRSFAIMQTWKWGFQPYFNREGVDAMYNPARSPYVPHWTGVDLMVRYVETFWAPSISAYDLMDPKSYSRL